MHAYILRGEFILILMKQALGTLTAWTPSNTLNLLLIHKYIIFLKRALKIE